ncbi:Pre-mRNA-splicing factor 38, partial [Fragariocoptes setiger]
MANRTVAHASTIHGTNPQFLIEKIIRYRIYESKYWREDCFALSADILVDRAVDLHFIGGVYGGNIKPTPFLCLTLKLLQIQPTTDIILEYMAQEDFKYLRALGAFYFRLTAKSVEIYTELEKLLTDSRKLRRMNKMGNFELTYMDEFIDSLMHEERVCDVILPRISERRLLERKGDLQPRISEVEDVHTSKSSSDKRSHYDSYRDTSRSHQSHRSHHSRHRPASSNHHRHYSSSWHGDDSGPKSSKRKKTLDEEIEDENRLRAKLGLKPLKP